MNSQNVQGLSSVLNSVDFQTVNSAFQSFQASQSANAQDFMGLTSDSAGQMRTLINDNIITKMNNAADTIDSLKNQIETALKGQITDAANQYFVAITGLLRAYANSYQNYNVLMNDVFETMTQNDVGNQALAADAAASISNMTENIANQTQVI